MSRRKEIILTTLYIIYIVGGSTLLLNTIL